MPKAALLASAASRRVLALGASLALGVLLALGAAALWGQGWWLGLVLSALLLASVTAATFWAAAAAAARESQQQQAEQALREARDAAVAASVAKTEFMANISHELRTPLQSIIGFSELGQRRARDNEAVAAMFGDILRGGRRMLGLVNDLLDLARAESTRMSMDFEFVDLRLLIRAVARELLPQSEQRGAPIRLDLPPTPLSYGVDAIRFEQVLRNVLANAVKFSPPGQAVEVLARATAGGGAQISVADRGPGIPETELERVFDAFVQSTRTKDGSGGTGLGLAISRHIMTAHGGSIVAQVREGGGSVFVITLPGA